VKAKALAKRMAARDTRFIGKSSSAGVAEWLPVAQGILDGFAPVEKQLKAILKSNQARLDANQRQLDSISQYPSSRYSDDEINAHAGALVQKRMRSVPFNDWVATPEPPVNGNGHQHHDFPAKDIAPDWKDIEGFFS
jgi:uncharacterized protein YPO0396